MKGTLPSFQSPKKLVDSITKRKTFGMSCDIYTPYCGRTSWPRRDRDSDPPFLSTPDASSRVGKYPRRGQECQRRLNRGQGRSYTTALHNLQWRVDTSPRLLSSVSLEYLLDPLIYVQTSPHHLVSVEFRTFLFPLRSPPFYTSLGNQTSQLPCISVTLSKDAGTWFIQRRFRVW